MRVGALRPLKLCRHLRPHGWEPLVLCDALPGQPMDPSLNKLLPEGLTVYPEFSPRASRTWLRAFAGPLNGQGAGRTPGEEKGRSRLPRIDLNPELVPFGEHLPSIPHALRAGRRIIRETRPAAIVASIDPHAAGEVGLRLSRETGLPLVLDFRDPWSVCELRRPMRPAPVRYLVDRLERRMVRQAAAVILNTETTRAHYLSHYPDIPAARFHVLHNMNDPTVLTDASLPPGWPAGPTLLFLGHLRRFVDGEDLFALLAELRGREGEAGRVRLVVAGQVPEESLRLARSHGVEDALVVLDPVPISHTLPLMERADVLLIAMNRTVQRLPAKFFDYAMSSRPMLAFSEAPELNRLVEENHGRAFPFGRTAAAADFVAQLLADGPVNLTPRHNPFTATGTAASLAGLLDQVAPVGSASGTSRA